MTFFHKDQISPLCLHDGRHGYNGNVFRLAAKRHKKTQKTARDTMRTGFLLSLQKNIPEYS
ncbi:MAG: hypothetical protein A2W17_02095 [Planctomycetes bacterium RBG_16_41_13]|nr:MAG: hypothetical protein A2W17_02095 [Planctomycetes bacterium RBG_16_41_13]